MATHSVSIRAAKRGVAASPPLCALIKRAVTATLSAENVDVLCSVAVLLTDDEGIREINLSAREKDSATDVLSFPLLEIQRGEKPQPEPWDLDENGRCELGEMIISMERATAQAAEFGHSLEREVAFLTVHSVLHMLGYDHELDADEEKLHFSRQEEILDTMGIKRDGA